MIIVIANNFAVGSKAAAKRNLDPRNVRVVTPKSHSNLDGMIVDEVYETSGWADGAERAQVVGLLRTVRYAAAKTGRDVPWTIA